MDCRGSCWTLSCVHCEKLEMLAWCSCPGLLPDNGTVAEFGNKLFPKGHLSESYCQKYSCWRIDTISTGVILLAYYFYWSYSVTSTLVILLPQEHITWGTNNLIGTRPCVSSNLKKMIYIHNVHVLCPATNPLWYSSVRQLSQTQTLSECQTMKITLSQGQS